MSLAPAEQIIILIFYWGDFNLSISSLFNLAFYPFLFNSSNGLFLTITAILVTGYVFKIVWNLVKNKN